MEEAFNNNKPEDFVDILIKVAGLSSLENVKKVKDFLSKCHTAANSKLTAMERECVDLSAESLETFTSIHNDIQFLEPRGRFNLKFGTNSIIIEGKGGSGCIPIDAVTHLCLIPSHTSSKKEGEDYLVVTFDKALKICGKQMTSVLLNLRKDLPKPKPGDPLPGTENTAGNTADETPQTESRRIGLAFKHATHLKVYLPNPSLFTSVNQQRAFLRCHKGVNEGAIYPLSCGMVFVKPLIFIAADDIASFTAGRGGGSGNTRFVDIQIETTNDVKYEFSNIDREELAALNAYVRGFLEVRRKKLDRSQQQQSSEPGNPAVSSSSSSAALLQSLEDEEEDDDDDDDDDEDYDDEDSDEEEEGSDAGSDDSDLEADNDKEDDEKKKKTKGMMKHSSKEGKAAVVVVDEEDGEMKMKKESSQKEAKKPSKSQASVEDDAAKKSKKTPTPSQKKQSNKTNEAMVIDDEDNNGRHNQQKVPLSSATDHGSVLSGNKRPIDAILKSETTAAVEVDMVVSVDSPRKPSRTVMDVDASINAHDTAADKALPATAQTAEIKPEIIPESISENNSSSSSNNNNSDKANKKVKVETVPPSNLKKNTLFAAWGQQKSTPLPKTTTVDSSTEATNASSSVPMKSDSININSNNDNNTTGNGLEIIEV